MIRYVDIDAFEEELRKETADCSELEQWSGADYSWMWRKKFYEVFKTFPAADVVEVRHGKWVMNERGVYECSVCGRVPTEEQKQYDQYCSDCGAKMDGDVKDA